MSKKKIQIKSANFFWRALALGGRTEKKNEVGQRKGGQREVIIKEQFCSK